jgi:hypothetical protein
MSLGGWETTPSSQLRRHPPSSSSAAANVEAMLSPLPTRVLLSASNGAGYFHERIDMLARATAATSAATTAAIYTGRQEDARRLHRQRQIPGVDEAMARWDRVSSSSRRRGGGVHKKALLQLPPPPLASPKVAAAIRVTEAVAALRGEIAAAVEHGVHLMTTTTLGMPPGDDGVDGGGGMLQIFWGGRRLL